MHADVPASIRDNKENEYLDVRAVLGAVTAGTFSCSFSLSPLMLAGTPACKELYQSVCNYSRNSIAQTTL